jgi:hypothetical protein
MGLLGARLSAPLLYAHSSITWQTSVPAGRPGKPEVRGGHRQRRSGGPKGHVGSARQGRVSTGLPRGHRAGLALPCWG